MFFNFFQLIDDTMQCYNQLNCRKCDNHELKPEIDNNNDLNANHAAVIDLLTAKSKLTPISKHFLFLHLIEWRWYRYQLIWLCCCVCLSTLFHSCCCCSKKRCHCFFFLHCFLCLFHLFMKNATIRMRLRQNTNATTSRAIISVC